MLNREVPLLQSNVVLTSMLVNNVKIDRKYFGFLLLYSNGNASIIIVYLEWIVITTWVPKKLVMDIISIVCYVLLVLQMGKCETINIEAILLYQSLMQDDTYLRVIIIDTC